MLLIQDELVANIIKKKIDIQQLFYKLKTDILFGNTKWNYFPHHEITTVIAYVQCYVDHRLSLFYCPFFNY